MTLTIASYAKEIFNKIGYASQFEYNYFRPYQPHKAGISNTHIRNVYLDFSIY